MTPLLFVYAIASLMLAAGLSGGWRQAPAQWVWGLASVGAWLQFLCVLYYIFVGRGAAG